MISENMENNNWSIKQEKFRIRKNLVLISIGFLLLFTSYSSLSRLQSSINSKHGVGNYSLSTTYVTLIIAAMFLPTLVIRKLTAKWTIAVSMCGYMTYCAAQFYPTFFTLIPTAAIVGLCASTLWSAKCFYLTQIGNRLAKITAKDNSDIAISSMFSIFFAFFQSSVIWGNVISSLVLSIGAANEPKTQDELNKCGANFCPGLLSFNTTDEDDGGDDYDLRRRVNILSGILLGCGIGAIALVAFFVDPLDITNRADIDTGASSMRLLSSTLRQMKTPNQMLLILITIYSGLEQGFLGADYTSAFITCSMGVGSIGWIFIAYGVTNVTMSYLQKWIIKYTGRIPLLTLAYVFNIGVIITWLLWMPTPSTPIIFYLISIMWGFSDSIFQCQVNAIYGILFPSVEEAAFANYRLWESLGLALAYLSSNHLCVRPKLYILIAVASVGTMCYYVVEYKVKSKKFNKILSDNKANE